MLTQEVNNTRLIPVMNGALVEPQLDVFYQAPNQVLSLSPHRLSLISFFVFFQEPCSVRNMSKSSSSASNSFERQNQAGTPLYKPYFGYLLYFNMSYAFHVDWLINLMMFHQVRTTHLLIRAYT
jgi:hypothetical protein